MLHFAEISNSSILGFCKTETDSVVEVGPEERAPRRPLCQRKVKLGRKINEVTSCDNYVIFLYFFRENGKLRSRDVQPK